MLMIRQRAALQASTLLRTITTGTAQLAGSVSEVHSDDEFKKVIDNLADKQQLAIVDFTARWCGPCKFIAPHFEQLSQQYPQVRFLKVDIDTPDLRKTVADHNITGVPTFVVYKGANRAETFTGARLDYLKQVLNSSTTTAK